MIQDGKIKARTKWKEIYPLIENDERYKDMLGNPGSNPLELFWDLVDKFDQQLEKKIVIAEEVIKKYNEKQAQSQDDGASEAKMEVVDTGFSVTPDTTWEQFTAIVDVKDEALKGLTEEELRLVFETVCCCYLTIILMLDIYVLRCTPPLSRSKLTRKGELNVSNVICKTICDMR